jgi:4-hydroxybenzoate polyprenyltransferase
MKIIFIFLKIVCVAANWYFAIIYGLSACVNQSPFQLVASLLWIFVIIMTFPLFKKRRDLNEDKRSE